MLMITFLRFVIDEMESVLKAKLTTLTTRESVRCSCPNHRGFHEVPSAP